MAKAAQDSGAPTDALAAGASGGPSGGVSLSSPSHQAASIFHQGITLQEKEAERLVALRRGLSGSRERAARLERQETKKKGKLAQAWKEQQEAKKKAELEERQKRLLAREKAEGAADDHQQSLNEDFVDEEYRDLMKKYGHKLKVNAPAHWYEISSSGSRSPDSPPGSARARSRQDEPVREKRPRVPSAPGRSRPGKESGLGNGTGVVQNTAGTPSAVRGSMMMGIPNDGTGPQPHRGSIVSNTSRGSVLPMDASGGRLVAAMQHGGQLAGQPPPPGAAGLPAGAHSQHAPPPPALTTGTAAAAAAAALSGAVGGAVGGVPHSPHVAGIGDAALSPRCSLTGQIVEPHQPLMPVKEKLRQRQKWLLANSDCVHYRKHMKQQFEKILTTVEMSYLESKGKRQPTLAPPTIGMSST